MPGTLASLNPLAGGWLTSGSVQLQQRQFLASGYLQVVPLHLSSPYGAQDRYNAWRIKGQLHLCGGGLQPNAPCRMVRRRGSLIYPVTCLHFGTPILSMPESALVASVPQAAVSVQANKTASGRGS